MHLSTNLFLAVVGGLAVNAAPAPMMRALVGALALGAGAQQPIINNQVVDPAVAAPVGGHHNVWAGNPLHVPAGHPDNVWIGDNNNYAVPQVDFSKYTGATGTIVGQDNGGDSFIFNSDKEYLSLENLDDDSLSPPQLEELEDAFGDNNSDEEFHDAVSFPDIINYNVDHSFSAESPETAVVNAATDDKDMMFDALDGLSSTFSQYLSDHFDEEGQFNGFTDNDLLAGGVAAGAVGVGVGARRFIKNRGRNNNRNLLQAPPTTTTAAASDEESEETGTAAASAATSTSIPTTTNIDKAATVSTKMDPNRDSLGNVLANRHRNENLIRNTGGNKSSRRPGLTPQMAEEILDAMEDDSSESSISSDSEESDELSVGSGGSIGGEEVESKKGDGISKAYKKEISKAYTNTATTTSTTATTSHYAPETTIAATSTTTSITSSTNVPHYAPETTTAVMSTTTSITSSTNVPHYAPETTTAVMSTTTSITSSTNVPHYAPQTIPASYTNTIPPSYIPVETVAPVTTESSYGYLPVNLSPNADEDEECDDNDIAVTPAYISAPASVPSDDRDDEADNVSTHSTTNNKNKNTNNLEPQKNGDSSSLSPSETELMSNTGVRSFAVGALAIIPFLFI